MRRNRGTSESKHAPIDAAGAFERIVAAGIVEVEGLEPVSVPGIAASFAALGVGQRDGGKVVVGYAPRHGGDAALATVAFAQGLAEEEDFRGEAVAVAPQWSARARRRLGALGTASLPFRFRAVANAALAEDDGAVEPDRGDLPALVSVAQVAAGLTRAADRALFLRAAASFEGLAAKHGGAVRGVESRLELVLLARRVAAIHAGEGGVRLEVLLEERSSAALGADGLAGAMDRLEGLLRKRLNDRRVREGEEGLRAQAAPTLAEVAGVRHVRLWPVGGSDSEVIDLVGVDADGRPVVGAIRSCLRLSDLGVLLDAALALRPALPALLAGAEPPLRIAAPRLILAAAAFDDAALRGLASLALEHASFDIRTRRGQAQEIVRREVAVAPRERVSREDGAAPASEEPDSGAAARSRRRGRQDGQRPREAEEAEVEASGQQTPEGPDFDEISLFDLADDPRSGAGAGEANGSRRSRRGRGRRRRGRAAGNGEEVSAARSGPSEDVSGDEEEEVGGAESDRSSSRRRGRRRGRRGAAEAEDFDVADDVEDVSDTLVPLEEVFDLGVTAEPAYEDEEEEEEEDDLTRRRREAEERARSDSGDEPELEPEEMLSMPRGRAAIVVHADRGSLICGLLLARDLRQVQGIWVYGQQDLMTFFRGVPTDLGATTPIYVIGFTASPARDALQAAALYRGRLAWFDHHDWPPEDLVAMREAIGKENLHVLAGAESCLAEILSVRTRRSRFSDKIVELATGHFSQHDYERWGRLWWHRLGEVVQRTGDRRADLDPLLDGRPSDLAKEAATVAPPPEPPEVAFVAQRDFRLVHFHGFTLVALAIPADLDPHLTARVARERYDAEVSVSGLEGGDLVLLGADEGRGRRSLDLAGMVEHLVSKHDWVVPLRDEDRVARLRIRDLAGHPDRFDELISEIAMGRSILEG